MTRSSISCGRDLSSVTDLANVLEQCGEKGFDFITAPIVHPRFQREFFQAVAQRRGPVTRSDKVIKVSDWSSLIVAKLSPWIQLDSSDPMVRRNSEKAFFEEMNLAIHLNMSAILIPLRSMACENLARCINHILLQNHHHVIWIQVPMIAEQMIPEGLEDAEIMPPVDPWEMWNKLRGLCSASSKLVLALEVGSHPVPSNKLNRWCGEPVKLVVIPTSVFSSNKTGKQRWMCDSYTQCKGYPVLSVIIQTMLEKFFKLKTQFLLTGGNRVNHDIATYWQYLNYRYQCQPGASEMETFSKGYEDYLQSPLQPLMDNLDTQTYDVFEKDPFKYLQYENAIAKALEDRVPESDGENKVSIVMVVGAGRGPLVDAVLKASSRTQKEIKVFAVEKNPGAVVTLLNRQIEEWGDLVTVVSSDMREWKAPEKADILVSELLGSFGDNELSPECLDGAQCFLKDDGISIPSSYTSFLAPVSSAKLHLEVSLLKDKEKAYPQANFETPYVVRLHNTNVLAEPQACFKFYHPNRDLPICNDRFISLEFQVQESSMLHGFSGYFDSVLYEDFHMSIHPHTHSDGMISWFPIFFPLKIPVYLEAGCSIKFHIWRLSDKKKVWYEWCLTQPCVSGIHNPNGRSYWIGL